MRPLNRISSVSRLKRLPSQTSHGDLDRLEELHLEQSHAGAFAGLAAPALDVEGEAPLGVAAHLRLGQRREEVADLVPDLAVGRRVAARRAADRALVDLDDLVEMLEALELAIRVLPGTTSAPLSSRASARCSTWCTRLLLPEPETPATPTKIVRAGISTLDVLQVVLRGAEDFAGPPRRVGSRRSGISMRLRTDEPRRGRRLRVLRRRRPARPPRRSRPPSDASARADVDEPSRSRASCLRRARRRRRCCRGRAARAASRSTGRCRAQCRPIDGSSST